MRGRCQIASLLYHEVTDDPRESGFQRPMAFLYKHTPQAFRENLNTIAGLPLVPELVTDIAFDSPGRHLLLTFDDGGKSAVHIGDELVKRGWRGHFFVTTGLAGTRTFLDRAGIRGLRRDGHLVGSHSHSHPDIFCSEPFDSMVMEWRTSCDILEQILGEPCMAASVPGGDISRRALNSAKAAGLRYLFTSEPWLVPRKVGECWVLGRVCLKATTSIDRVHEYVQMQGWTKALMYRQASVMLRTAFYPLYKAYVHKRTISTEANELSSPEVRVYNERGEAGNC